MPAFNSARSSFTASAGPGGDPPAPPTGNITQFLTSDGGSAAFTESNFSGPTRDKWHNRLGLAWTRTNTLGNWLDSAQAEEGTTPYASTGAAATVGQVLSATVTALVARWLDNGENRGFYLSASVSVWPLTLHGRTAASSADRPKLVVVTNAGTFTLTAAANAYWATSSFTGIPSALSWVLAAGSQPAILRFDLATVTGTLTSATLSVTVEAFDTGHTGHVIDVFEADPPTIIVPEDVPSPVLGLAAEYADFDAFKASGHASLIFADDFEEPGSFDDGFTPAATRTLNSETGTTYARGEITAASFLSLNARQDVSVGVDPLGTPDVVEPELFGQYWLYLENDFGTTADTAIKIPAMGVQFGYWNPVGYWQQTTGNGGVVGTGLKVDPGGGANYQYEGHSIRLLTGNAPASGDDDPYVGWFGIAIYPYNLDQVGGFPAGEAFPNIAIRGEQWYCIDIRVKQNTMSGAQDGLGNYATAVADGIFQTWINGYIAYSKTTFRWRKHAEMGVQGIWLDVYHGGTIEAPSTMHYRIDRVSVATTYIGPSLALPAWVPLAGEVAVLTNTNGKLTNHLRDVVAPYFEPFYSLKSINDYSGGIPNPHFGDYGATLFFGGGHSSSNDNSLWALVHGLTTCTFARLTDPPAFFGTGTDATTQGNNGNGNVNSQLTWESGSNNTTPSGAVVAEHSPASPHSYGAMDVVGPADGGAAHGSFGIVVIPTLNRSNDGGAASAWRVNFADAATTARTWTRQGSDFIQLADPATGGALISGWAAPVWTQFVPAQNRTYIERNTAHAVTWFDHTTQTYEVGTGTQRDRSPDNPNSGIMFAVPSRTLLVFIELRSAALRIAYMDVSASDPSWVVAPATLSAAIAAPVCWSSADWCQHNSRIIVGDLDGDDEAVKEIEIPATLTDTWTVTRAAFGAGQTITWTTTPGSGNVYKKWAYNSRTRSFNFMQFAQGSGDDTVYVYRPRNT